MINVLYVDDEPDLLTIGKLFLERSGKISLDTTVSAREAIGLIQKGDYHAIISDYQMPDVDGIAFLKKIRQDYGDLPFVLFTGKSREEIVIEALNNGANFYLQKGGEPKSQFAELEHKVCQAVDNYRAQEKLHYFNRLYSLMHEIHDASMSAESETELYHDICRIAIDDGKFVMARVGRFNVRTGDFVPLASCDLYQGNRKIMDDPDAISQYLSLGREAAVHGIPRVKNRIGPTGIIPSTNPDQPDIRFRSTAAFPIFSAKGSTVIFQAYAKEPDFFMEKELRFIGAMLSVVSCSVQTITLRESKTPCSLSSGFNNSASCTAAIDNASEGILIVQDDRIRYFNAKCLDVLPGYSPEELADIPFTSIVHPDDRERVVARYTMWMGGDRSDSLMSFKIGDNAGLFRWVTCRAVPAEWDGMPAALVYLSDITDRWLSDQALHRAREKDALMGKIVRHDIANRLTVVRGHLRRIRLAHDKTLRNKSIERAEQAAADIHALLETARQYQDIGMNAASWQNIREVINEVTRGLFAACGVQVSVITGRLEILADPLLPNVIANLMDNAIRHGNHVTGIRVQATIGPHEATIFWEDNGIGIPPEEKETIFEAGFGRHTGLGLFFSREILSLTGITIRETGTYGSGARFEIHVPQGSFRCLPEVPDHPGRLHRPAKLPENLSVFP